MHSFKDLALILNNIKTTPTVLLRHETCQLNQTVNNHQQSRIIIYYYLIITKGASGKIKIKFSLKLGGVQPPPPKSVPVGEKSSIVWFVFQEVQTVNSQNKN